MDKWFVQLFLYSYGKFLWNYIQFSCSIYPMGRRKGLRPTPKFRKSLTLSVIGLPELRRMSGSEWMGMAFDKLEEQSGEMIKS